LFLLTKWSLALAATYLFRLAKHQPAASTNTVVFRLIIIPSFFNAIYKKLPPPKKLCYSKRPLSLLQHAIMYQLNAFAPIMAFLLWPILTHIEACQQCHTLCNISAHWQNWNGQMLHWYYHQLCLHHATPSHKPLVLNCYSQLLDLCGQTCYLASQHAANSQS